MKPRIIIPFLILLPLIAGIWMLVSGIGGMVEQNRLNTEYAQTEGYYTDYAVYSEARYGPGRRYHGPTYSLIYTYSVDGVDYTVSTDYGTGLIPEYGTARTVYYDPAHPGTAVLGGTDSHTGLIVAGVMFTGIPLVFILGFCYVMDWLPKTRINIIDLIMGGVMTGISAGFLLLMEDGVGFHPMLLIPWLMLAAGVWLMIRAIFFPGQEIKRK